MKSLLAGVAMFNMKWHVAISSYPAIAGARSGGVSAARNAPALMPDRQPELGR
jgi:hypothetical protein